MACSKVNFLPLPSIVTPSVKQVIQGTEVEDTLFTYRARYILMYNIYVCACACVYVCARARARVRVCVCVCVRA
jgi:hypothetical protein